MTQPKLTVTCPVYGLVRAPPGKVTSVKVPLKVPTLAANTATTTVDVTVNGIKAVYKYGYMCGHLCVVVPSQRPWR